MLTLATLLSLSATASAQATTDYDSDNDGYIDVANHAQLNAIRYDLDGNGDPTSAGATAYNTAFPNRVTTSSGRMGCPSGTCTGYELTANIDLDTDSDGNIGTDSDDAYYNSGAGWLPIGNNTNRYSSNFKGNGNTINNLFISRSSAAYQGLFGVIASGSRIETLGVINADVHASDRVGILAGQSYGIIVACYTTGKMKGSANSGGLVGRVENSAAAIYSSYSTAYVDGGTASGGLVGNMQAGSVRDSYATGRVVGTFLIGGLIGNRHAAATVTASYWDTSTSGQTTSAGGSGVTGKTTRQLQSVTSYTGIYANWNTNLDGVTGNDDPWAFGNKMQYPMLDYKGMSTDPQGGQAMGIPDNWNHPIVGELVGVCLVTQSNRKSGSRWIWERSDNGDAWETISGSRSPTYTYIPTTADVNHFLRAKVQLSDNTFAYTRNLGGRVKNASDANDATQGSAVSFVSRQFTYTAPEVGTTIEASDPAPSGAVDTRYGWQRCPNTVAPHTDCTHIVTNWVRYKPVAADVGMYLRMYVYYETSGGVWTRHETSFTGQVAAASQ